MADNGVPISSLWQRKFKAAERENDPRKLSQLLKEAEIAISVRLGKLAGKQTPECEAIAKAGVALRQLKESKLSFPKWESDSKAHSANKSSLLGGAS
jgi:hypothetical protein